MSVHDDNPFARPDGGYPPPAKAGPFKWILTIFGVMCLVCCGGGVLVLGFIGATSPETSVYPGNQVPQKYLKTARDVGALEANEVPRFFYSDGIFGIESGFFIVTATKVSIYSNDGREPPLTVIKFDEIDDAELFRDESTFADSMISIETKDGDYHSFPVSSEFDRDEMFFEAIQEKLDAK